MSAKNLFIPSKNRILSAGNEFHWNLGDNEIAAESTMFYHHVFPPTGEESRVFTGLTGSSEAGDFFSFTLSVPYLDQDVMEYTYTLNDGQGLALSHGHSIPAPPGFEGVRFVDADDAQLTIRLDRTKGTVQGDFVATFKSNGYRLAPSGTFKLTRSDQ
ncbi:hypothetical protein IAI51_26050 [Pseudomonas sp. N40(2020)]|uniref:hypothetical protein n=1 Tax=Pseudomonas sp. N40(2020) TaxID=2767798 RepID=UPI0016572849|nr:hypothetical protein [Pseudomonas sp. N40(2020)]MBC8999995.1 hypothetical protein [Pseudomonas sp. N40(2020)]